MRAVSCPTSVSKGAHVGTLATAALLPMVFHALDDRVLQEILSRLPPAGVSAAQLVCRHWSDLIIRAQIWQQHVHHSIRESSKAGSSGDSNGVVNSLPSQYPWRDMCLHRAATSKWCSGRLVVSATFNGHTAPVTCIAVTYGIVITGSSDGTARVWDLSRGVQQHVLRMPSQEPVVAVALPSVSLAVTATAKGGAVLWRGGAAIRRFETLPGGRVTCVALTDTQLLLGSSAGTVQHFDLFSGQQQLITRHSSGVTCLSTHRHQLQRPWSPQQQQQQQHSPGDEDEWLALVGCVDGQVSCFSTATGRVVWQLPTRHPSKVVGMQLVQWQPLLHIQPQQGTPPGSQAAGSQLLQPCGLLYVLNARSQVICWQLPGGGCKADAALASSAATAVPGGTAKASQHSSSSAGKASSRSAGQVKVPRPQAAQKRAQVPAAAAQPLKMPLWPLSVASVAPPAASRSSSNRQQHPEQEQQGQQQQPVSFQLQQRPHNTSTCMLSPVFGRDCLLVGSSLGYLTVVQLHPPGAAAAGAGIDAAASAATSAATPSGSRAGSASDSAGTAAAAAAAPGAESVVTTVDAVGLQEPSTATADPAGSSSLPGPSQQQQHQEPQPPQQSLPGARQQVGAHGQELQVVRHCSLSKLGKVLAGRQAASIAALRATQPALAAAAGEARSSSKHGSAKDAAAQDSVLAWIQQHLLDGSKVMCMEFGPRGEILVGLGSGHVCCLRLKHAAGSLWS